MNNKGFAISTVIYGLSILGMLLMMILMGVLSSNRANSTQLVDTIENELNQYSRSETSYSVKMSADGSGLPEAQEYNVPPGESGWYRIELWGSAGGKDGNSYKGGKGAYTTGIIQLNAGDTLYFYIGDCKNKSGSTSYGGRETDVRYVSGTYTNDASVSSRIMIAAGGGSGANSNGGTLEGYNSAMTSRVGIVDVGGDYKIIDKDGSFTSNNTLVGYPVGYSESGLKNGAHNIDANNITGGEGYVNSTVAGTGGVSFIAGYAGSGNGIKIEEDVEDEDTGVVSREVVNNYYFVDAMMYSGVNSGPGRAKIEKIMEKNDKVVQLPRKNKKFNNVTKVRDCIDSSTPAAYKVWSDMKVMSEGDSVAGSMTASGANCKEVSLDKKRNIDEIAVWHKAGYDYKNHTIQVYNGTKWETVKGVGTGTDYSETETPNGIRVSAYQIDSLANIPNKGNYYLLPVLSENMVVSAKESSNETAGPIGIDYIQGLERQKWSIELITDSKIKNVGSGNEYKIVELLHNKALSIYEDENIPRNSISANRTFNNASRNEPQIWKINPVGNGTYTISTAVPSADGTNTSGSIFPLRNSLGTDLPKLIIGKNNVTTQRFKIISIDYSGS